MKFFNYVLNSYYKNCALKKNGNHDIADDKKIIKFRVKRKAKQKILSLQSLNFFAVITKDLAVNLSCCK